MGFVNKKLTIQGHVLYNSDAKIFYYSAEQTVQTIGNKQSYATITGESNIVGLNSENLKSGEGAWILNGQQSTGAWGQQLATDDYPVLSDYKVIKAAKGDNNTYWATFSDWNSDFNFGEGQKVYTAKVSNGVMTLTSIADKIVSKGEGVLVKGNSEYLNALMLNDDTEMAEANNDTETAEANNDLVATPAEPTVITANEGYTLYRLTYNNVSTQDKLGFYLSLVKDDNDKVDETSLGKKLKATPGKAYLNVSTEAATTPATAALARSFVFPGDDETTGIGEIVIEGDAGISGSANANDRIYNLQGQQVTTPVKGLYIKNNKKVIIK